MERFWSVGDRVKSTGNDSNFRGEIIAEFRKLDGLTIRYVVENPDRILHIFAGKFLEQDNDFKAVLRVPHG